MKVFHPFIRAAQEANGTQQEASSHGNQPAHASFKGRPHDPGGSGPSNGSAGASSDRPQEIPEERKAFNESPLE